MAECLRQIVPDRSLPLCLFQSLCLADVCSTRSMLPFSGPSQSWRCACCCGGPTLHLNLVSAGGACWLFLRLTRSSSDASCSFICLFFFFFFFFFFDSSVAWPGLVVRHVLTLSQPTTHSWSSPSSSSSSYDEDLKCCGA